MSITEDEAGNYWSGSRDCSEWSYFEDGFDRAVEEVGTCMQCYYLYKEGCPIEIEIMKDISKNSYYCASFYRGQA